MSAGSTEPEPRFDDDAPEGQFLPLVGGRRRPTIMVAAFEGWNDAGEAASEALNFLNRAWGAEQTSEFDPDEYYDFQFSRPVIRRDASGERKIVWPSTRIARVSLEHAEVVFVHGIEPSYRWQAYTAELLEHAADLSIDCLILVGALLADVPHTRPIPVTSTSQDRTLRERMSIETPQYEGPVGIVGVLGDAAMQEGIPTLSLWAAVPHYVAQSPSPKAQLALLHQLEEMLAAPLDTTELTEEAEAWERGVDELATDDPEVAAYVRQLEEAKDAADLPEASGESIAREFERYLRRRGPEKP
ncbi:PAC2 family protein [Acaricomes phytoseiuli]|uniref:PAC2 family protein n=1 Tax=Acaricomes phytoseiuli TaxID=291968 RepID=UPI00036EC054|nr:PAC2 family protein [Acaricomes phytoseiuli]MCW1248755.1 PAC2 family protein [Acaricomes phytoseiuli]